MHALPPRLPAAFLLASLAEAAPPCGPPTTSRVADPRGSRLPAALTWARARAGGGGVPAAHRAAGRRSGARSRRPQLPGAETEAEGGASRAAGSRQGGAGGRAGAGPARCRRARARARRKPPGTPAPALTGPRRAHPSPWQRRAGQYAASHGLPDPPLVVIERGREFKLGSGARARLRGVAGAEAGLCGLGARDSHLLSLQTPFRLLFSFPPRMWGAEEVAGNTSFARSGSPIKRY